jgi:hypothetical protein
MKRDKSLRILMFKSNKSLYKSFIMAGVLLVNSNYVFANYSLSTNLDFEDNKTKKDSKLSGDFGIRANQMIEDVGEVIGNRHFGDLNLKYQSFNSDKVYKGFEFSARVNDQEQLMYSIQEAIVEWRFNDSRLALGRSTLDWSHTDETWGLGKINNRINFDYFDPGQEGLIGAFYDKQFKNGFNLSAFGSFVYVPEMNPALQVNDDGTIDCKNPWCTQPNSSAQIDDGGEETPIYYNVNYPEITDVIMRYSLGLKLGHSAEVVRSKNLNMKLTTNAFFLRKPENNISIAAEISVQPQNDNRIFVDATPQFYYHDVTGGNIELDVKELNTKFYASAISIVPEQSPDNESPLIVYTPIKPRKLREDYVSGGAIYDNGSFKSHIGYIARVSEYDRQNETLAEYPRWNQAGHIALDLNITRKISVSLDYKYDMLTEDRLTMFNSSYRFGPNVVAAVGVNIIGTNPDEESFWSQYENNDSVYSSLKYTF